MRARTARVGSLAVALLTCQTWGSDYQVAAGGGQAHFDYHVVFFTVPGDTDEVTADFALDPKELSSARGTVTVGLSRLGTGIALRDQHMREALETGQFPNTTFTLQNLTGVTRLEDGVTTKATANGRLTLHGVTRPLSAPVEVTARNGAIEVSTAFSFDPHAFGVNYPGGASGIDLRLRFSLTPGS